MAEYTEDYMRTPEQCKDVAAAFPSHWNFHCTLGAINGKPVRIKCQKNRGCLYNVIRVSSPSSSLSWQIQIAYFYRLMWKKTILDGSIGFPEDEPLPGDYGDMSYFLTKDDVFALRTWLINQQGLPNDQRIFN